MLPGFDGPEGYLWRGVDYSDDVEETGDTAGGPRQTRGNARSDVYGDCRRDRAGAVVDLHLSPSPSSLCFKGRLRLPSPINGALPSSSMESHPPTEDLITMPAGVSHVFRVDVYLSERHTDSAKSEGVVRVMSMPIHLSISSCMNWLAEKPPPEYSFSAREPPACGVRESDQVPQKFRLDRFTSLPDRTGLGRFMRSVRWSDVIMRERIRSHWQENGGRCLCFAAGDKRVLPETCESLSPLRADNKRQKKT